MRSIVLSVALISLLLNANAQTGIPVPQMTQSDDSIRAFLTKYNIPGATVAIAKDGKIVYMRSFGYSDRNQTVATQPYNLFRIASLSKQITSIAIMKLMQEGRLALSDKVFGPGGILQNFPLLSTANIIDSRIYNITVQHLLEHSAGWNRDLNCNPSPTTPYPYYQPGCDPISFPLRVTMLQGATNPVNKNNLVKFLLEKSLDFAPGTGYNYSNIGYLMLGDIIEQKTGMSYTTYVKDSILAPLGIYDMNQGKNLLADKQEREGEYVGNNGATTLSCYGDGTYVPWEYGGFSVEAMDAHGGWIASSRDMLKLLAAVDGFATKPDILTPATIAVMTTPSANNGYYAKGWAVNSASNWWHTGSLDGTASEWVRTSTGYTWIIICNKRNGGGFDGALDDLGWDCINSTSSWPTWDLMASPTLNAADISFSNITDNSVKLSWTNGNGSSRMIVASEENPTSAFPLDGTDYTANSIYGQNVLGSGNYVVYNGTGNTVTVTGLASGKKYYFRVMEYNKNATTGDNALYLLGANPQSSVTTSAALPIKLSSFTAVKINAAVKLDWVTQQEVNSGFFTIERSADGKNFTIIGTVNAAGNTQAISNYSFTDNAPQTGKNFYRLKETDLDGTSMYSGIVSLLFNTSPQFNIVTYEGKNYFTITKNPDYNFKNAKIVIRDITGRPIVQHTLTNASTQSIYTSALAKGIYVATIYDTNARLYTQKIVLR